MNSEEKYILAIDQGTSGTKSLIFSSKGKPVAKGHAALNSQYPQTGFVEQQPDEIYQTVLSSVAECLEEFTGKGYQLSDIQACGITNQRETFLLWDQSGNHLTEAVVWQCKRSVEICRRLKEEGWEQEFRERTGLLIDPYFSGTKLLWLIENDDDLKAKMKAGEVCFGTVDTWLLYRLTGGEQYFTDVTNACRTMFFNIHDLQWDSYLLDQFGLESLNLPEALHSGSDFGESDFEGLLEQPIPIEAMIGDSHAAAFGEQCFEKGTAKATLGTGSSILMNTGDERYPTVDGLLGTISWSTHETVAYGLEGAIVSCGSTLEWLKNQLGIFEDTSQIQDLIVDVGSSDGVMILPAFSGMGAPYWDMEVRGKIAGLTFGSDKRHLLFAAVETIPFQIRAVIDTIKQATGIELKELNADGGISKNKIIMQMLSNLLGIKVKNPGFEDVSAWGVATIAGLEHGMFKSLDNLKELRQEEKKYSPIPNSVEIKERYLRWKNWVEKEVNS
ncbi:glycerol kinase GlpK [Aliifodinibius sp. S!AR15-10]|uniref:FGGY-family carbohydrate kinase n=1 Tax=Aliifodinibius sp. S!AR15-10 TaxID=2950437 RepID=UPI00285FC4E8|nr:glycerol kinase GlpK [Aliifodinibius sp. S!AR15-10]MDR8389818.1 glycerol kinase GlpK [Aliifodinibius sp. S!AR15-10]